MIFTLSAGLGFLDATLSLFAIDTVKFCSEDLLTVCVPRVSVPPLCPGVVQSLSWLCGAHHAGFVLTLLSGLTAVGLLHRQIPREWNSKSGAFLPVIMAR